MSGPMVNRAAAREAMPADSFMSNVEAVSMDDLLRQVSGLDVSGMNEELHAAGAEARRIAALVAMIFGTLEGREVLEWLLDATLRRTMCPPGLTRDQRDDFILRREGENDLVRLILRSIQAGARQPEPR